MFEFLFKYPRSVYARGQFALLGAWPKWMLVLLILAAAAGLAWLIRSHLPRAAPAVRGSRLALAATCLGQVELALDLLGIATPERM